MFLFIFDANSESEFEEKTIIYEFPHVVFSCKIVCSSSLISTWVSSICNFEEKSKINKKIGKMYQIKPVLERKLIEEMPDCMYNLKPINKGVAMDSKNSQENNVS